MSYLNSHKIIVYLQIGISLHVIAIVELLLAFLMVPLLYRIDASQDLLLTGLRFCGMGFFISLPILSQLDVRSGFQNYKQIKDQFIIYGFDERILKPVLKSKCQRDAAIVSAEEVGLKAECDNFFKSFGYKWYHIIPDFVFSHPQFLLSKYFWKTTFFVPKYEPKIDFLSSTITKPKFHLVIAAPNRNKSEKTINKFQNLSGIPGG
ncbi:MAG: hypothetical protein GXO89_10640 [Chlorobi bacterium]|nr:hypothetical protein [Chlorobiota bacterium]